MNIHKNARLTPPGRLLLVQRIEGGGWGLAAAAIAAGISERQSYRWLARYRRGGAAALADRSSAPQRCKHRIGTERIGEIERLRQQRMSGPAIARQLSMPVSTVGAILRRLALGKLAALAPKPAVIRYERQRPGELIHLDTKKLGRIAGIGHRIAGRTRGVVNRHHGIGWEALHVCIDDATRLAYSEILANERKDSAIGFLERAGLVCGSGRDRRTGYDRQRFGLSEPGFPGGAGSRRAQAQAHPAVHATHQRQGRAVYPNQLARVGLCPGLPNLAGAHRGASALA